MTMVASTCFLGDAAAGAGAGGGCRSGRGKRFAIVNLQFHLTEPQCLPRLEDGLGNFLAVDERAVGGIKILDEQVGALQEDFGVVAGNRGSAI